MIPSFSKHTLLTGAGWSHNWGGRLASEVWQSLIGHTIVKRNEPLRKMLLDEPSFEAALAKTYAAPFADRDRQKLENAILDTFISMDREIGRPDHDPWINIYKVQEFLFSFWGHPNDHNEAGYLFTLNQDLFFERNLYNEHVAGAPGGVLPGLVPVANQRWFTTNIGHYSTEFTMHPAANPAADGRLLGQMNVIKLHGSFNWRSPDGRNLMVVGAEKTGQIAASPLLSWYAEIFREVLAAGGVRLMIVGYGFGDEHINAVIAGAIEKHGLSVLIWDTAPNLKERILAAPHGPAIWNGLISTVSRRLIEVFPSNQAVTEEYVRIRNTFFA